MKIPSKSPRKAFQGKGYINSEGAQCNQFKPFGLYLCKNSYPHSRQQRPFEGGRVYFQNFFIDSIKRFIYDNSGEEGQGTRQPNWL